MWSLGSGILSFKKIVSYHLDCECVVDIKESGGEVALKNLEEDDKDRLFTFDAVFGMDSTQQSLYEKSTFPIVEAVFTG